MSKFKFVVTANSIVVTPPGKSPVTVQSTAPNYRRLKEACLTYRMKPTQEAEAQIERNLCASRSFEDWIRGHFTLKGGVVYYKEEAVPAEIGKRILDMATAGEDPSPLLKFWEKLQQNPSWRSVQQLYKFLDHQGIPIASNGNFLAYKGVKENYTDQHTGTVDNTPGQIVEMPRNKISDDPDKPCHYGLHVGSLSYAQDFSQITIVCEVNPADVVCVPNDSGARKMRVCRYRVLGNHNGELLPSTTYELEDDIGYGSEVVSDEAGGYEDPLVVTREELELAQQSKVAGVNAYRKRTGQPLKPSVAAIEAALILARKSQKNKKQDVMDVPLEKATKKPVEKKLAKARKANMKPRLKVPSAYRKIHRMDSRELLDVDIDTLRKYAGRVLHIVNASKILGGKAALIKVIQKTRKKYS